MDDVATNIRGTTDAHERNNSVVVGAPKAAGTDALGNNYTIRAGGNRATATITFTGAATEDETIVIIDADGVSKTYTAKNSIKMLLPQRLNRVLNMPMVTMERLL